MKPRKPQSKIYQTAIKKFAEEGFEKTTMDNIAEAASMTKGNLYRYASNKKDLYENAIRYGLTQWHQAVEAEISEIENIEERFKTLCFTSYNHLKEEEDLRKLLHMDQSIFPINSEDDRFADINNTAMTILEDLIIEGIEQKIFRAVDHSKVARYIYSVYIMFIIKTYVKDDTTTDDSLLEAAVELNLNGLLMR